MSRFIIGALRAGHYGATEQLSEALPAAGETVEILSDTSGAGPWFYAVLDEPLKYRTAAGEDQDADGPYTWITDVVFRPHNLDEQPSFGMRAFPVDFAVVLDPHMREAGAVDLDRIDFIAVVEIDDADHDPDADTEFGQPDVIPATGFPQIPVSDFPPGQVDFPEADFPQEVQFPEADFPQEVQFPAADFPQEVQFPEADFPQEVEFPAADFPQGVEFPAVGFPPGPDDLIEDPFPPPARPPLILPEPAAPEPSPPEPSATFTRPPEPLAAPRRPSAPPRAVQVEELITRAEATVDRPRVAPVPRRTSSPITVDPPSARSKKPLVAGGVAAALLILGGWGFSALQSRPGDTDAAEGQADSATSSPESSTTTRPPSPAARPEDFAKVTRVLPPGYPPESCVPAAAVEEGGVATLACGRNDDQGGPPSATYTVFPDPVVLNEAFDRAVAASQRLICPGNIQSPGPWRRNATPQKVAGTLFCGTRGQNPVVIWSDTERMLLSTTQSSLEGPTLDALYAWWTQHS